MTLTMSKIQLIDMIDDAAPRVITKDATWYPYHRCAPRTHPACDCRIEKYEDAHHSAFVCFG